MMSQDFRSVEGKVAFITGAARAGQRNGESNRCRRRGCGDLRHFA